MYKSIVQQRGPVTFPTFEAERIYMLPFIPQEGLPTEAKRWQDTVDAMLDGVDAPGPAYLMVDQAFVKADHMHRRPGPHIDGYWNPGLYAHGGFPFGSHGYSPPAPSSWSPVPSWGPEGSYLPPPAKRKIPAKRKKPPEPEPEPPMAELPIPIVRRKKHIPRWRGAAFSAPEAIILASDVAACEGYTGSYSGDIGDGGDCSTIDLSGMQRIELGANTAYAGNVTFVHQSLPVMQDCLRTLVRLNVPGWSPR